MGGVISSSPNTENNNKKEYLEEFEQISKQVPDGEQQLDAVKSFYEGTMSYAEMRARAG